MNNLQEKCCRCMMVDESLLMLQPQETPDIDCLMQVARFLIEFDYRMITKLQLSAMMNVGDKKLLCRLDKKDFYLAIVKQALSLSHQYVFDLLGVESQEPTVLLERFLLGCEDFLKNHYDLAHLSFLGMHYCSDDDISAACFCFRDTWRKQLSLIFSRLGIQYINHHSCTEKIFRLFMTAFINDDVLDDDAIGRFHMNIKHGLMI